MKLYRKVGMGVILTLGVLSLLYACILLVFILKEPFFLVPVEIKDAEIPVRNDDWGEGHFTAKRENDRIHLGLDIAASVGDQVYASKSGIALCHDLKNGYGKLVVIFHPDNFRTRYGHLDRFNINNVRWVNQGDIIGFVGKSGNADYKGIKPHLHFEIRKGNKVFDPMGLFKRNQKGI